MEHIESDHILDYFFKLKNKIGLEKLDRQRLQQTLSYLESKQRELERNIENDTRTIESMIKYLKKDMLRQFQLSDYDESINLQLKNTDSFIEKVQNIIENL